MAKGKPSVPLTHSISPTDSKSAGSKGPAGKEVHTRIKDEGQGLYDSEKGAKSEDKHGPTGRKGNDLELEEADAGK